MLPTKRNRVLAGFAGLIMGGTLGMVNASADIRGDIIVFTGATGSLVPPVQAVGGSGSFAFASKTCAIVDTDHGAGTCAISASGSYVSFVCGTGTASGTATVVGSNGETETLSFTITFNGGQGELFGTTSDLDNAAGVVNITPTGGNCATGVTQFTATGVING